MGEKENGDFMETPSDIFKIPGEPAIVINKIPPLSPSTETSLVPCAVTDVQPHGFAGFGEWLEGREVQKLFDGNYFIGKVTQFDKEMGWYRVIYDDGDFEDLEWHELMEILVPLDVNIPLTTLASKIIKKSQKLPVLKAAKIKSKARSNGSYDDGKGKKKIKGGGS